MSNLPKKLDLECLGGTLRIVNGDQPGPLRDDIALVGDAGKQSNYDLGVELVRRWNAHEDLLKACKTAEEVMLGNWDAPHPDEAREAIRTARFKAHPYNPDCDCELCGAEALDRAIEPRIEQETKGA